MWFLKGTTALSLVTCTQPPIQTSHNSRISLLKEASSKNLVEATFFLGICYFFGCGFARDEKSATKLFLVASRLNHRPAMLFIGICFEFGFGFEKCKSSAKRWYTDAANLCSSLRKGHIEDIILFLEKCGSPCSWFILGRLGRDDSLPVGLEKTYQWLKLSANSGYSLAIKELQIFFCESKLCFSNFTCFFQLKPGPSNLGSLSRQLKNTCKSQVHKKAFDVFNKAAVVDHFAEAQFLLGLSYQMGYGVEVDLRKAKELYTMAANQHHGTAQQNLETCLSTERDSNIHALHQTLQKVSEKGYWLSCLKRRNWLFDAANVEILYLYLKLVASRFCLPTQAYTSVFTHIHNPCECSKSNYFRFISDRKLG